MFALTDTRTLTLNLYFMDLANCDVFVPDLDMYPLSQASLGALVCHVSP